MNGHTIKLGTNISVESLSLLTSEDIKVILPEEQRNVVSFCRNSLEKINSKREPVYGVSTGFGHLQSTWIEPDKQIELQINLIRSHAIGTGDEVPSSITKTAMILLANSLSKGHSGITTYTLDLLINLINKSLIPITYTIGSLGASGDLAPLAHIALSLIGEGEIFYEGKNMQTSYVYEKEGLQPVILQSKEGLALINGTHFVTSYSLHLLKQIHDLFFHSLIATGLSIEALKGTNTPYDLRIAKLRNHPGQMVVSKAMNVILEGSEILNSHKDPLSDLKTQDSYSLRCVPQVMGAVWDSLAYLEKSVSIEVNSVTDNPLVYPEDGDIISGGNFHAEPIGLPLETVNIALIELANITEARISRLVSPFVDELPTFLASNPGIESGYMIAHYTAAALLNKVRSLAYPNLVDNIPVSGGQEDHVSMAMNSATKTWEVLHLVQQIVGFELLMATRGLEIIERSKSSIILEEILAMISDNIEVEKRDHVIRNKLLQIIDLMNSKNLLQIFHNNSKIISNRFTLIS